MMESVQLTSPVPETRKHPLWLALRVIDEPGQVFTELARRPRGLVPILLLIGVSLVTAFAMPTSILTSAAEEQLREVEQRQPGSLPAGFRERAMARVASPSGRTAVAGAIVAGSIVGLCITTLVLMLTFNAISGAGIRFSEEWAIATHAFIPQVLGALVLFAGAVLLQDPQFRVSLGFLVGGNKGFLYNFADQITFFGAWSAFLLAVGNQIRTRERSIAGPLGIVAALWLAVHLAWAALKTVLEGAAG